MRHRPVSQLWAALSRGNLDGDANGPSSPRGRLDRDFYAVLAQSFQVERDRLARHGQRFFDRAALRHHEPACRRADTSVFMLITRLAWRATVTRPGFVGCRSWTWLAARRAAFRDQGLPRGQERGLVRRRRLKAARPRRPADVWTGGQSSIRRVVELCGSLGPRFRQFPRAQIRTVADVGMRRLD